MLPYHKEEGKTGLHRELSREAIELAIQGRWDEAETVNQDIIERFPTDVEAYNRLGRALIQLGDLVKAKEAYAKTLELQPGNVIAKKNVARLTSLPMSTETVEIGDTRAKKRSSTKTRGIAPDLFVTEVGKTGVARLRNMASGDVLAKLVIGDRVQLKAEGQRLIVESEQGEYVGEVGPKHAMRLVKLISGGNRYDAAILNMGRHEGHVTIKEAYQHPSQVGYVAFPVKGVAGLRSYGRGRLLRHDIEALEGEAEEETYEAKETEYHFGEEESELEGFTVVDGSTKGSNGEEIK